MDFINKPLGMLLKLFSDWFGGNYLVAILIFALATELILLPFGIKQQKNSIKQARLRPKELAIRKKYAGRDDKPTQQKMAQEIQELYQKEGYNPMSGCLPLLIQLPLLFALYGVITQPLQYICGLSNDAVSQIAAITGTDITKGTMTLLKPINDLGANALEVFKNVDGFNQGVIDSLPNLSVFGVDLSTLPSDCFNLQSITTVAGWIILLVPVATFFSYFFSTKIIRKLSYQPVNDAQQAQMGCSNKVMDIAMPLMSVFFAFTVPAALGIYWTFKSLVGILKQFILAKAMPLPKFTEEDFKAAEKEVGGRIEKQPVTKSGRVVRSLHHIDDEDFEDTAEAARAHKEALEAQEAADKQAKQGGAKKKLIDGAVLKDDDRAYDKKDEASEEASEDDSKKETE